MHRFSLTSLVALVLVVGFGEVATAGSWRVDTAHSTVSFKVRHLFSKVTGQFTDWEGKIEFDASDLSQTSAEVKIVANSVDTGNDQRDKHLRSKDFFDVKQYPTLEFRSTKVEKRDDQWVMIGDLTLHGQTRPVEMTFSFLGAGPDPWGGQRAGFTAATTIQRKDFGIEWNAALDQGGMVLGEDVQIEIEIEAVEDEPGR